MDKDNEIELEKAGLNYEELDAITETFVGYVSENTRNIKKDFTNLHVQDLQSRKERLQELLGAQQWLPFSLSFRRGALKDASFSIKAIYEVARHRYADDSLQEAPPFESLISIIGFQANTLRNRLKSKNPVITSSDIITYKAAQAINKISGTALFNVYEDLKEALTKRGLLSAMEMVPPGERPVSFSDNTVRAAKDVLIDYVEANFAAIRADLIGDDIDARHVALQEVSDIAGATNWPVFDSTIRVDNFTRIKHKIDELGRSVFWCHEEHGLDFQASDPWPAITAIVGQHGLAACMKTAPGVQAPVSHKTTAAAVRGLHGHANADPRLAVAFAAVEALMPKEKPAAAPKPKAAPPAP